MKLREMAGLGLLIAACGLAPLGWFISTGWFILAAALGIPGALLFFTARMSDRLAKQEPNDVHVDGPTGFRGARIFGDGDSSGDGD